VNCLQTNHCVSESKLCCATVYAVSCTFVSELCTCAHTLADGELLSILSHAQLSPVLLTYLTDTPRHLCRLAQTCTLANYICERDFLWRRMIAHHFSGTRLTVRALSYVYFSTSALCSAVQTCICTFIYRTRESDAPCCSHAGRRCVCCVCYDYVVATRFSPLRVPRAPNVFSVPSLVSDAERDLNPCKCLCHVSFHISVAPFGGRMPNIFPNHPDAPPQFVHPLADDPMNDPLRIGPPRYPRGPRGDPNLGNLFPNPSRGRHNPDDFWDGSGSSGGGMFG
jgi:hypothetical protein